MYRSLLESPEAFGSMQAKLQSMIQALIAVSGITDEYVHEQRLDSASQSCLVSLAEASQTTLAQLQRLLEDFEKWGMQDIRRDETTQMTERLEHQIQGLGDINGKIRATTVHLEKLLKRYITQVQNGERVSSIRSIASTLSVSSSDQAWAQLRLEMQDIGISPQKFERNRDMIIRTIQGVLQQEIEQPTMQSVKNVSRLNRLMSYVTLRSNSLLVASRTGRLDDVKVALQKGAYIDTRDASGDTALILAAQQGHLGIVKLLLSCQAEVNRRGYLGCTALLSAVMNGNLEVVQPVREHGASVVDYPRLDSGVSGVPRLYQAATLQNLEFVEPLLRFGTDTQHSRRKFLPLTSAMKPGDVEVVRALLNAGADTEATIENHVRNYRTWFARWEGLHTAIHLAILLNQTDIVQLLLEYRANVNARLLSGCTPLYMAVCKGHVAILRLLLASTPDIDAVVGKDQITALHRAVEDDDEEMAQLLLSHGAKILNLKLGSPLHLAAENGNEAMARLLLKHGAKIDQTTPSEDFANPFSIMSRDVIQGGATPLWLAAANGHLGMVQLLLQGGTALETMSSPERCRFHDRHFARPRFPIFNRPEVLACSAVHIAAAHGHQEVVKSLVEAGTNVNAPIDLEHQYIFGRSRFWKGTLLHIAVAMLDEQAFHLSLELGVNVDEKDSYGRTALHIIADKEYPRSKMMSGFMDKPLATKSLRLEMIDALLGNGASVNVTDSDNQTPLHYASRLSHDAPSRHQIYNRLVLGGADDRSLDRNGYTPRQLRVEWEEFGDQARRQ
ncbi:MAG: hypothetical protein Q9208_008746 [Pyrenodesmia sp. 3 TL-2023]